MSDDESDKAISEILKSLLEKQLPKEEIEGAVKQLKLESNDIIKKSARFAHILDMATSQFVESEAEAHMVIWIIALLLVKAAHLKNLNDKAKALSDISKAVNDSVTFFNARLSDNFDAVIKKIKKR